MKEVKVSACIITYNQQEFIAECLEGAVNQVLDYEYEIVIGDDCSTDNTLRICREYADKYADKIRLIKRDANLGMAKNWIDTISNCDGKYIAICEGDDFWTDTNKLQKQVDLLEKNPTLSFCFHKAYRFDARNEAHNKIYPQNLSKTVLSPKDFFAIPTIPTASVVFRNNIELPELYHSHLDTILFSTLLSKGNAGFIDEQMSSYRLHDGGISDKYAENWYLERRINELSIEKNHPNFSSEVKKEITGIYINHVILYLNKNRGRLSLSQKMHWLKSVCFYRNFYKKPLKQHLALLKTMFRSSHN